MEKRLRQAQREGLLRSDYLGEQIEEAERAEVVSKQEAAELRDYHAKVRALLAVDDFASEELRRSSAEDSDSTPARAASDMTGKTTKKKVAPRKKTARKPAKSKKKTTSKAS